MNKIVINTCYGGFSLSRKAIERYWELKDPEKKLYFYKSEYKQPGYNISDYFITYRKCSDNETDFSLCISIDLGDKFTNKDKKFNKTIDDKYYVSDREYWRRHDPILIQVVEELGEEANGYCAELEIVKIDSDLYRIDEYDGYESVITPDLDMASYINIKKN